MASAEKHGGCNTTCTACNVSLYISTCTAWAEELAMLWLHGVNNKVHVTGRETGADEDFGRKKFQHAHMPAANRLASHRLAGGTSVANGCAFIVRLACVYLRSVCDYFSPRSLVVIIARRPHGGRTLICHHLPLLCDQTDHRQVFEHVQKPNFDRTFTCVHLRLLLVIAQMPYVWRTFTCVHWR